MGARSASQVLRAVSREATPVRLGRKMAEARGSSTFRSRVWAISTGRTSCFSSDADSTLECRATFFAPPSSKVRKAVAVSWHLREIPETMRGQGAGASRPRAPKARNASCPFGTSGAGRPRSLHAPRHSSDPEPPGVPLERIGGEGRPVMLWVGPVFAILENGDRRTVRQSTMPQRKMV